MRVRMSTKICDCSRDKTIQLELGGVCCSFCEKHRAECEARYVLNMPTKVKRNIYLSNVEEKRGLQSRNALQKMALLIYQKRKQK